MKYALITLTMFSSIAAQADGFTCTSERDQVAVKVYNHTNPEFGTRNGAVMVVSDLRQERGNRTVARFRETNLLLSNKGSVYESKVDLRFNDTNKEGTLLGESVADLKKVRLNIDFNYSRPLADGETTGGVLALVRRDGSRKLHEVDCVRYLKN